MNKRLKVAATCMAWLLLSVASEFNVCAAQPTAGSSVGTMPQMAGEPQTCIQAIPRQQVLMLQQDAAQGAGTFVVLIDSVNNSIDVLLRCDSLRLLTRYEVDKVRGRHDVKNIMRPKALQMIGKYVAFVASNQNDSSVVGIVGLGGVEMSTVRVAGQMKSCLVSGTELIAFGDNQQGYDLYIFSVNHNNPTLSVEDGFCTRYNYHVPKQSERILKSDRFGIGLTLVAVVIVFLALICIALIIKGFGSLAKKMDKTQDGAAEDSVKTPARAAEGAQQAADQDVYAAIAAAIHLYNEELHDEENSVITIDYDAEKQSAWSSKYFNMNQHTPTK